jgi:ParB/RepB/Spo0J family partition protein
MKKKNQNKTEQSNVDRSPVAQTGGTPVPRAERKADELRNFAWGELEPDGDQPRKTFGKAELEELAASIREQGIIQPLIVRVVPAKYRIREADMLSEDFHVEERGPTGVWEHAFQAKTREECLTFAGTQNLVDRIVIVAGERRWRASGPEYANLAVLPCIVRDVAGHAVFAQQYMENESRVNVSALEEAEALEKEFRSQNSGAEKVTVEAFGKSLGISRAAMYGKLALTRLHAPVREALVAGKISVSVAAVVAIVPLPAQQEKLLKHITNEGDWHFPFSVRDVQGIVENNYCAQLKEAPFKLDTNFAWDKKFPKELRVFGADSIAEVMGCTLCPFRSGNLADTFPELKSRPNVCTRPDCFALKVKAHWQDQADTLVADGKTVLTTTEMRKVKDDYVRADDNHPNLFEGSYYGSAKEKLGKHAPEAVVVATTDGLVEY